jgi:hypothetical protein
MHGPAYRDPSRGVCEAFVDRDEFGDPSRVTEDRDFGWLAFVTGAASEGVILNPDRTPSSG